jgi:DNA repair exonuclease SbcCD ATPase subunit
MNKLTLKKLQLKDWRSLNVTVTFNEDKTTIHAKNKVGKSSLFYAWCWLLSGYTDAHTAKNFNLFDEKQVLSKDTPSACVKADVLINGIEYTIERRAKAAFKRERGSNEYTKSPSDTYTTLIDDIEVSASSWKEFIENNLCDSEMIIYVLSGDFLSTLTIEDKNSAREVMMKIVGEIKDDDYTGDYSSIADGLAKGYSLEQIEEQAKNRKKELEKEITSIPRAILSRESVIADYTSINFSALRESLQEKKDEIAQIEQDIIDNNNIRELSDERQKQLQIINEKCQQRNEMQMAYVTKYRQELSAIELQIESLKMQNALVDEYNNNLQKEYNDKDRELRHLKAKHSLLSDEIESLRKKRDEIKEMVFVESRCVVCGNEYPAHMIDAMRNEFNNNKKAELDKIVSKGKLIKQELSSYEESIEELTKYVEKGVVGLKEKQDVLQLAHEFIQKRDGFIPFEKTQAGIDINNDIESMRQSLPEASHDSIMHLTEIKKKLFDECEEIWQKLALEKECERLKEEIESLRNEHRMLGVNIAREEQIIDAVRRKREETANIISSHINKKLKNVSVDMFRTQKDGSRVPDCIIRGENGIQYASINNSAKTLINIELQRLMMSCLGVELPIWIDESKNFDDEHLPTGKEQMIYLFASNSPRLVVE